MILRKLKDDNHLYFRKCLKIKDKKAHIVPFDINDSQGRLNQIILDHYTKYPDPDKRPTLYIIILKARQQGMSTATVGVFFKAITIGMPGDTPYQKTAMVISYDEDSAQTINEMSDRFYQHLPSEIKPMKRNSRGKGLILENPTNVQAEFEKNPGLQSKFLIDTANNLYAGSGKTVNYVHISELSLCRLSLNGFCALCEPQVNNSPFMRLFCHQRFHTKSLGYTASKNHFSGYLL